MHARVFWVRDSSAGDAAGPTRRPSDAVAITGKPFLDEWLAETRQPVGPWTGRMEVNSCPYLATYCESVLTACFLLLIYCMRCARREEPS